jgi:hypothetical protein
MSDTFERANRNLTLELAGVEVGSVASVPAGLEVPVVIDGGGRPQDAGVL